MAPCRGGRFRTIKGRAQAVARDPGQLRRFQQIQQHRQWPDKSCRLVASQGLQLTAGIVGATRHHGGSQLASAIVENEGGGADVVVVAVEQHFPCLETGGKQGPRRAPPVRARIFGNGQLTGTGEDLSA